MLRFRIGKTSRTPDSRGGVSPLRCLAARGAGSSIAVEVVLRNDDIDAWRYRIEFNQGADR
jgi:hypothetical protein